MQATLKMIVLSALYYQFVEDGPVQPGEEEAVAWARSKAALSAKLFEPGKLISEISRLPAHATAALLGTCYINSDVNVVLANTFRADATKQIRGFKISVELTARGVQGLLPTLARAKNLAEVAIACQPQWGAPTLAAATAQIQQAAGLRVSNPAKDRQLAEDPKAPKLLVLNSNYSFLTSLCLLARCGGAPFVGDIFATKDGRAPPPSKVGPRPAIRSQPRGMVRSTPARAWTLSPVILSMFSAAGFGAARGRGQGSRRDPKGTWRRPRRRCGHGEARAAEGVCLLCHLRLASVRGSSHAWCVCAPRMLLPC